MSIVVGVSTFAGVMFAGRVPSLRIRLGINHAGRTAAIAAAIAVGWIASAMTTVALFPQAFLILAVVWALVLTVFVLIVWSRLRRMRASPN